MPAPRRPPLKSLPIEEREVVVLRIWGGRSFEEIAELIGKSTSTAHRRFETGLKTLREACIPATKESSNERRTRRCRRRGPNSSDELKRFAADLSACARATIVSTASGWRFSPARHLWPQEILESHSRLWQLATPSGLAGGVRNDVGSCGSLAIHAGHAASG